MNRQYESRTQIEIASASSDGLGLDNMLTAPDESSDALSQNISLQTQANILESDTLALQVIEALDLEHNKDFVPRWNPIGWFLGLISPEGQSDPPNAPLADAPRRRTRMLKIFNRHLKVKPVAGTRLIDIKYSNSDPKIAAAVANRLADGLINFSSQRRNAATNQAAEWLGGQLTDVKRDASSLQEKVVQLQRDAGVYSLGATDSNGKDLPYSLTLDQLQLGAQALNTAESTRILRGGIYEMVKDKDPELISGLAGSALNGASPSVANSFNLIQNLRAQEATLESQIATDSSKFGSAYPKLAEEKASLATIKQQVVNEANRIGERAATDYQVAQASENELRKSYERDKAAANQLNNKAIEYSIARQEAGQARQLYETLFQRIKEAGIIEGLQSTNISVVDPGRVPAKPLRPNIPLYLAVSIIAGLFFGSVAAFFSEAVDDRILQYQPVAQELNIPLLAVLPLLDGQRKGLALPFAERKQITSGADVQTPGDLPIVDRPATAFSEALRGLGTALQLPHRNAVNAPKIILVTSSIPNEGKTTVSTNLAALLALTGNTVLLIEGDLRKPSFNRFIGMAKNPNVGLSTALSQNGAKTSRPPTEPGPVAGLEVLYAGPVPQYPWALFGKDRMRSLLDELKPRFDYIIIDSPPLLAVNDAVIISHLADMTLLIARDDLTTVKSLRRATEILSTGEAGELGVVLNGLTRRSASYSDYRSYGYVSN
jgi:capsular exopolysaccharide synthesis family protein